jgi:YesN/AraC family two-component response regulator
MNDNQTISKPYVGLTDYNFQELDYSDGELSIINHLTFSSRMHATQVDRVFVVFCSQGELRFEMDGSDYAIKKDDVFVGYPNAIYNHFKASYDVRCRLISMSKSLLQEMLYPNQSIWNKTLYLKKHYIINLSEQEVAMQNCMNLVLAHNLGSNKTTFRKEIIHSLVQCIVYELCRTLSTFVQSESNQETNQRKILFDRFISYMTSCDIKKQPLSFYADKLCVSTRYLTMVCREISGRTAYDWICDYVQNDVRFYLLHTNLSIKEIAVKLGFCNLSFFGKYVRENLGKSPSEFRRQLKDE